MDVERQQTGGPSPALRFIAALLLCVAMSLTMAAPASAHSQLVAATPAENSTVSAPISDVALTFNENVQSKFSLVKVTAPSGRDVHVNQPAVIDGNVRQGISGLPETGTYKVSYRVVSADGHPVTGAFDFTYAGPTGAPAQPAEASQESHDGSFFARHSAHFVMGVAAIALVVLLTVADAFRKRRRK